jgi:hypothetical protein
MAPSDNAQDTMRAELEALGEPKPAEPAAAPAQPMQETEEPDVAGPCSSLGRRRRTEQLLGFLLFPTNLVRPQSMDKL